MLESDCGICGSTYHTTALHLDASRSNKKPKRDFLERASIVALQGVLAAGIWTPNDKSRAEFAVEEALALWDELGKVK